MPFAGTHAIHPDWAAHHRPTAAGTLTAACTITTGGAGGWEPDTGPSDGTPTPLYTGACSFTDLTRSPQPQDAAGQSVAEHPYVIGVDPAAADIPVGARVTITACTDDPRAVGKAFTVVATSYESLMLERVLLCDLDTANQPAA